MPPRKKKSLDGVSDTAPADDTRVVTVHGAPQVDGNKRPYTTYVAVVEDQPET